jgi:hypothetical protein
MKKNINTYEELLTSLALSGDSAAFHSLVEPILRTYYVKMISEGMKHVDVSEKLCEKAASLYKSFLVSGKNPIDFISDSEFEKSSGHSGETDFLQSGVVNDGEQLFSHELMHSLQQFKRKYRGKFRNGRKSLGGIAFSKRTLAFTVSTIAIIISVVVGFYLFSSSGFDVHIVKKSSNDLNGSLTKKNDSFAKSTDVPMAGDTLKKETSKDSLSKVDTVSKLKPKPRRTVTETPQAGSAEITNAFESSPAAQPKINREQSTQVQSTSDAASSQTQTGGSENNTRSSTPAAAPQPSTQSQDSSWGF